MSSVLDFAKLASAEAGAVEVGAPIKRGLDSARVLLVDDSRLMRMGLRRSLESIACRTSPKPAMAAKPSSCSPATALT